MSDDKNFKLLIEGLNKQEVQMRINAKRLRKHGINNHAEELEGAADITRGWIKGLIEDHPPD